MINVTDILKKEENIDFSAMIPLVLHSEYRRNFTGQYSREAYNLLATFSLQYNNALLLDIGTKVGCSALALAYNKRNRVISFDIDPSFFALSSIPENIQFVISNILEPKWDDTIRESEFIYLDTYHNGDFELDFYNHLNKLKWNGIIIFDDIHLNDNMQRFWSSINRKKYDATNQGHWSGTGIVIFDESQ